MSFGDGGQDYGGGFDPGGQQDYGASPWANPYAAGTLDGFHQGAQINDLVAQQIAPIHAVVQDLRADADAATLIDQYPQLADEQVAEHVVGLADQRAARLGVPPERARSAEFIGLVIQAQMQGGQAGGPAGRLRPGAGLPL
jgi:hypothetical protein